MVAPVAELQFFTGTMDSGKSTLALQTNHNRVQRGLVGQPPAQDRFTLPLGVWLAAGVARPLTSVA